MSDFVRVVIAASEKAANIARIIRSEKELFKLLVEEKIGDDKNKRFIQDFKTLSDVLIQECLRHDISKVFPEMADNIFGEESNKFTNSLGESITVSVRDNAKETAELLGKVLDGNVQAAKFLAHEVHREITMDSNETSHLSRDFISSYSHVGIWIDPIDATNEYIRGSFDGDENCDKVVNEEVIWSSGLHCVTVLIGVFNLETGQPILGVINQPFWKFDPAAKRWQGRKFWGVSAYNQSVSSLVRYPVSRDQNRNAKKIIIASSSEEEGLKEKLKDKFDFVYSAGAGYKLLCVALGLADLYILTKPSTHFWDTCGPHAILKSLGGGIINYTDTLEVTEINIPTTAASTTNLNLNPNTADASQNTNQIQRELNGSDASSKLIPEDPKDVVVPITITSTVLDPNPINCNSNSSNSCSSSSKSNCCRSTSPFPKSPKSCHQQQDGIRKVHSFREISYCINKFNEESNYVNLGGLLAYRECQTANLAIQLQSGRVELNSTQN